MTREAIPLVVPDVGTFARALGRALVERHADKPSPPGHVEVIANYTAFLQLNRVLERNGPRGQERSDRGDDA